MLDFHEKRKLRSLIYSKPIAGVLILLSLLLSVSVFSRFQAERETALKRAEKVAELEELRHRASALEAEVNMLRSDRGIEAEIRDRYEVAKDGEQVIIIVGEESRAMEDPLPVRTSQPQRSIFDWLIFW